MAWLCPHCIALSENDKAKKCWNCGKRPKDK